MNKWKFCSLEELGEITSSKRIFQKEYVNKGIPFYRTKEIKELANKEPVSNELFISMERYEEIRKIFGVPKIGDILITAIGTVGEIYIVEDHHKFYFKDGNILWFKSFNKVNPFFLKYLLSFLINDLKNLSSGSTYKALPIAKLKRFQIPLPPLNEQKRIVAKIEALQERSQRVKAELEAIRPLLDNFRQSVLAAAFRGDLTKDWREKHPDIEPASELLERIRIERRRRWEEAELEKMAAQGKTPKDEKWKQKYKEPLPVDTEGLPELPDGWTYSFIEPLLSRDKAGLKTGPFGSLLKKHEHRNNGVPVLGIENISSDGFIPGNKIYIDEEKAKLLSDYEVQEGDIIISRSGTVGEICIVPSEIDKAIISTNLIRVSLAQNGILSRYFCSLFRGSTFVLNQVSEFCSGSTRDFLNQKILSSIVFPIAPIQEQKEIVKRIESLFKIADTIEQQYQKAETDLETLNQSILAKAFRGELVPQNPNDEPASVLLERIRAERETHNKTSKQKKSTTSKTTNRSRKKTTKKPPPPDTPTQLKLPGFE